MKTILLIIFLLITTLAYAQFGSKPFDKDRFGNGGYIFGGCKFGDCTVSAGAAVPDGSLLYQSDTLLYQSDTLTYVP